jgi:hypothetical protein
MKTLTLMLSILVLLAANCSEVWARRHHGGGHNYRRTRNVHVNINRGDYHRHRHNKGAVVAAGVVGLAVGAMVGSAAAQPRTVVVQQPVAVAPTYGTVIYALPPNCVISNYRSVQYYQCNGVYHQPIMGSSGVYYQIVPPPY